MPVENLSRQQMRDKVNDAIVAMEETAGFLRRASLDIYGIKQAVKLEEAIIHLTPVAAALALTERQAQDG